MVISVCVRVCGERERKGGGRKNSQQSLESKSLFSLATRTRTLHLNEAKGFLRRGHRHTLVSSTDTECVREISGEYKLEVIQGRGKSYKISEHFHQQ